MPRTPRVTAAGYAYHVLNRANRRARIFDRDEDYAAFESVLVDARKRVPIRLCAYAVMPNHWHLVLWPDADWHMSAFMRWLTQTHTQRWNGHRTAKGTGHLYQGRYKSFLVEQDAHFLSVCRYVESNPVRAGLVRRARDWRWGSAWRRAKGPAAARRLLSAWPVRRPRDWDRRVDAGSDGDADDRVRSAIRRGAPLGGRAWTRVVAERFGLAGTLRPRGRPRKGSDPFLYEL